MFGEQVGGRFFSTGHGLGENKPNFGILFDIDGVIGTTSIESSVTQIFVRRDSGGGSTVVFLTFGSHGTRPFSRKLVFFLA